MRRPQSNQEFYDELDRMSARLRSAGLDADGTRIWELIHKVAWTTSTELFGDLRIAMRAIRDDPQKMAALSPDLRAEIGFSIDLISEALDTWRRHR
jgi:hypothetical protein